MTTPRTQRHLHRLRNLALVGVVVLAVGIGIVWAVRGRLLSIAPAATFGAHMAPLGLAVWENHLVVALHGSWNSWVKVGYQLAWLPWGGVPAGEPEPFATGFLPDGGAGALGRPAGVIVGADDALYVSDDKAGFIYRIAAAP